MALLQALSCWPGCTLELSQGHHVAHRFALHPGKPFEQLCFFRPRLRVGWYTEVPANTLLGLFQLLGPGEVTVSTTLAEGAWSAACWMKPRAYVLAVCYRLWIYFYFFVPEALFLWLTWSMSSPVALIRNDTFCFTEFQSTKGREHK